MTQTIDWGDSSPLTMTTASTSQHIYGSSGPFTISVTLSDLVNTVPPSTLLVDGLLTIPPFTLGKISGTFKLSKSNADACSVTGTIPLVTPTQIFNGTGFTVDVGGVGTKFTLTSKFKKNLPNVGGTVAPETETGEEGFSTAATCRSAQN